MTSTTSLVELLLLLLIAASVVALITNRLRVPYTVALVFAGVAIDLLRPQIMDALTALGLAKGSNLEILTPEVVFSLFLPGLLFESSLHVNLRHLRENLRPVIILAVAGVVVATLVTGYTLSWWLSVPLASALVFGALISATDPISVIALFRELGISKRLTLIVESESLFNDGTAVVLFQILLAAAVTGQVSIAEGLTRFVIVVAGGLALGVAVGYAASKITSSIDEARIEITLTTIVAYGAYLAAEHLHVSGVIATVAAGIVVGNVGAVTGMSARTRVALFGFWEYLAFVINSLVFLLIGIAVHITDLLGLAVPIAIATAAVILGRIVTVYSLTPLSNRIAPAIPFTWQHVLVWGGLHGSVSMALALGLPTNLPERNLILSLTFGVVAFSIVVQGLTMKPLVAKLGLTSGEEDEYERLKARQLALAGARGELQLLRQRNLITSVIHDELSGKLNERSKLVDEAMSAAQFNQSEAAAEERRIATLRLALAERSALEQAVNDGVVSEVAAHHALEEANHAIDSNREE